MGICGSSEAAAQNVSNADQKPPVRSLAIYLFCATAMFLLPNMALCCLFMKQSMHFLGAAWQSRRSQVWKTLR
jgi:uncharacterized membrane protein YadS